MWKAVAGAVVAVTLLVVAGFVTLAYPFIYRDPLAEPFLEIDDAEGKAWLDSQIVVEIRGSFPEEEILESLEIDPPVRLGEEDLTVEQIAKFPWHEGFPWAKTRVTINPARVELFVSETLYQIWFQEEELVSFETITLPKVAAAYTSSAPYDSFEEVPTYSKIILLFNEEIVWRDEYLVVEPPAQVTTAAQTLADGRTRLSVIPAGRWENSGVYTLTIDEGVEDLFGHKGVEGYSLSFSTWPAPKVVEVAPFGNDLPVDSRVRVEFERPADRQTVEKAFDVEPSASGSFDWKNDRVMTWKPYGLQYSTTYTISVGGKAVGGDQIISTEWTFATRSQPRVVEVQPSGESTPVGSLLTIQFDRPVERRTVEEAFQIEPGITGSFDWESDLVVAWKPHKLEHSTAYEVSVGGESIDGDPIVPYEWTFATQDPPVFVEIQGGSESPTTLTAVATGGTGEYSYQWNTGETGEEIRVDLPYEETGTLAVTVTSGNQAATANMTVYGPPSPCPPHWEVVSEEICYKEETLPGPVRVFVARVDLNDPDVQINAPLAADVLGNVRTVGASALARNTIVSVNGDFPEVRDGGYFTLGPIVSNGNYVHAPGKQWFMFALDRDGNSWVGLAQELKIRLKSLDGSTTSVQRVNRMPDRNNLALFNSYWGTYLSLPLTGCYAVFAPDDNEASAAKAFDCGAISEVPLREGEFVLVGTGEAADWMKEKVGQPFSLETSFPLENVDFAVGGSHALIKDGLLVEELSPHLGGRHPRTAIGIDGDGFAYLVVVDGRSSVSRGMTLQEMQGYLSGLRVVNAINLDGGGSSTMVVQGSVMNTPSDGRERAIATVVDVTEPRAACWHEFVRC